MGSGYGVIECLRGSPTYVSFVFWVAMVTLKYEGLYRIKNIRAL